MIVGARHVAPFTCGATMGPHFSVMPATGFGRRRSIRLPIHNYAIAGSYFVTICAKDRSCTFGRIFHGRAVLSPLGEVVLDCWKAIPEHFPAVSLDQFVVMPNHIHGVVAIWEEQGATCRAPTGVGSAKEPRVAENPRVAGASDGLEGPDRGIRDHGDPRDPGIAFPPLRPPEFQNRFGPLMPGSLGSVIRAYKAAVTKQARNQGL